MKNKDLFKLANSKFQREPRNIIIIIISTLCICLSFLSLTIYFSYNNLTDNMINKNINFRAFETTLITNNYEKEITSLKQTKHIIEVLDSTDNIFTIKTDAFLDQNYDGTINLLPITANLTVEVGKGSTITSEDTGKMICPQDFFPDSSIDTTGVDKTRLLSQETILNQNLTFYYQSYNYTLPTKAPTSTVKYKDFQIVGVYNSAKVMNTNNTCYVSLKDLQALVTSYRGNYTDVYPEYSKSVIIYLDSYSNMDKVKKSLQELGYTNLTNVQELDTSYSLMLKFICIFLTVISIATSLIVELLYLKKKSIDDIHSMGLLRSIGYSKQDTKKIYILQNYYLFIIAYFISTLIFLIIYKIFSNSSISFLAFYNTTLTLNPLIFIISLLIYILIPVLISHIFVNINLHKEISLMLKMDN